MDQALIDSYRENGFVHVPQLLNRDEAMRFREAALDVSQRLKSLYQGPIFNQNVNVWREDETMRELTLLPKLAGWATALAGKPLRLWHDQVLIKAPHNNAATEFHQDQPYWPHLDSPDPISCRIALGDVRVEAGCMTFIPGSHTRTDLAMQNLEDSRSLFDVCSELEWEQRLTVPLRAGDCTFHHGRCAHMAGPNTTDEARVAHVVIFMDAQTRFSGSEHVVTQPLGLRPGDLLAGELFPRSDHLVEA